MEWVYKCETELVEAVNFSVWKINNWDIRSTILINFLTSFLIAGSVWHAALLIIWVRNAPNWSSPITYYNHNNKVKGNKIEKLESEVDRNKSRLKN